MTGSVGLAALDVEDGLLPNGFRVGQIAASLTPKFQELILLPTEQCNFRCTYCYEDFILGRMSEATQRGIERFLEKRVPKIESLRISWFGGEPLAAKDIVLRLSRHAHELALAHDVVFSGGLTTNAYTLDQRLFRDLLACRQNFFQITLDGLGATHDEVRRLANGRGTFDRIWANLEGMKAVDEPFEVLIRIHVRRQNIENLGAMMLKLGETFADDDRFRLDFEHLRNLGGAGGASVVDALSRDEVGPIDRRLRAIYRSQRADASADLGAPSELEAALAVAKQAGESAGAQRAEDLAAGGNYICYAARANSLLVRSNGRIGKCTVALNDNRNDLGALREDGTLEIDNDKLRPWLRGLQDMDPETLGCPLATLPSVLGQLVAQTGLREEALA